VRSFETEAEASALLALPWSALAPEAARAMEVLHSRDHEGRKLLHTALTKLEEAP